MSETDISIIFYRVESNNFIIIILEVLLASVAQKSDQDQIKVQPDQFTEYKDVAMVMAAAQRLNVKKLPLQQIIKS
ncbi:hypothetical protein AAV97_00475 [Acinetobacter sp. Ag2]|nr:MULTISPECIES: hypothetical protein [Acinetobacter]KKW81917.1 hypothetical protein AAV97_00475 [Acinetobacter sp. Ag2]MDV8157811.1 hypothetical protein [Acinetobacter bereziniae]